MPAKLKRKQKGKKKAKQSEMLDLLDSGINSKDKDFDLDLDAARYKGQKGQAGTRLKGK